MTRAPAFCALPATAPPRLWPVISPDATCARRNSYRCAGGDVRVPVAVQIAIGIAHCLEATCIPLMA